MHQSVAPSWGDLWKLLSIEYADKIKEHSVLSVAVFTVTVLPTCMSLPLRCRLQVKFSSPRRALVASSGGSLVLPNKPRSRPEMWYSQAGIRGW
jgi:hypothetical protein